MNENFIAETQDEFLSTLMSHTSGYSTTKYNGNERSIYFRPVETVSGLYIATFINSEVHNTPFTLAMVSAFLVFSIYLILILGCTSYLYYTHFKHSKTRQNVKILNFLRPYESDEFLKIYRQITRLAFVFIFYYLITFLLNHANNDFLISEFILTNIVFFICLLFTLSQSIIQNKIDDHVLIPPLLTTYRIFVGVFGALYVARSVILFIHHGEWTILLNTLLGISMLWLVVAELLLQRPIIKKIIPKIESDDSGDIQLAYQKMLFLLVIIFSVLPINAID
jgi:hypothetical protein